MNDFMIHVERIVRPIQATDHRKDRMREELLAHLEAAFEQERGRQTDEEVGRRRAIASLGDPVQLRSDLQGSVSPQDRLDSRIERVFSWHAPESALRYTLRMAVLTGASFFLAIPCVSLALLAVGEQPPGLEAGKMIACMGFLTGLNVFLLGFLYFKIRDSLWGAFGGQRSWLRAAGHVLASAVTIEGTLLFFLWSFTGNFGDSLSLVLGRSFVALLLPVAGVLVAWFRGPIELRHAQWELLDIA